MILFFYNIIYVKKNISEYIFLIYNIQIHVSVLVNKMLVLEVSYIKSSNKTVFEFRKRSFFL